MYRERYLGCLAGPLDHPGDTHAAERLIALVHENISRFDAFFRIGAPQIA
jgi:hypothetical protein